MSAIRVLVVDDFKDWRQFISSLLCADPFEIIGEASNGIEAIHLAKELQPTIVLMDIGLPGSNGINAGKEIQKLAPCTKIVFVSQEFDADIVRAALNLGVCGYVLKLDAAQELAAAVHSVICGKKFVSSSLVGHNILEETGNKHRAKL